MPDQVADLHYEAFISYRHKELDMAVAKAIHKQLETYRIPAYIRKKTGKRRMGKVFRDRDELPLLADLGEGIRQALAQSRWLIVVCSPDLLQSKWCMAEIDTFIAMGRRDQILTVLISGEPEESFPAQLRFLDGEEREPLAADVRADGLAATLKKVKGEKLRLLAPMLGVGFDDLRRRQRERVMKTVAGVSAACVVIMAGATAYVLKQNALLDEQKTIAQTQRDEALVSQSRFLAELSLQQLQKGDRVAATLLALEALPEDLTNPDRPLVAEAVAALRNAEITATNTGFQPVFTLGRQEGAGATNWSNKINGYYLYNDTLCTVNNSAIYLWDIGTGELLAERPLDPLDGTLYGVGFYPIRPNVYLIYKDHFQIVDPAANVFHDKRYFANSSSSGYSGVAVWTGGAIFYGYPAVAEYWKSASMQPNAFTAPLQAQLPFTCASLSQGSSTYSYLLATGHSANSEKDNDTVNIWDANAGAFLRSLPIKDEVTFVELSANRAALAVITSEGYISLWNPANAELLAEINKEEHVKQDHFMAVEARFSPDSATLAVCYANGIVRLYDTGTGRRIRELSSPGRVLLDVNWSADGAELLCAADDNAAYLFEAATGEAKGALESYGHLLEAVYLNSETILLSHVDGSLHIFARKDKESTTASTSLVGEQTLWGGLLSPDGKTALFSTYGGAVRVYDTQTGETLRRDQYYTSTTSTPQIVDLSWTKDGSGKLLVKAAYQAAIWDPMTGERLIEAIPAQIGQHERSINWVDDNADTTLLALNVYADWTHIHDAATGAELIRFRHNPDTPESNLKYLYTIWSPIDPDLLLTYHQGGDLDNMIRLWRSDGTQVFHINAGGAPPQEVAFSPDGQYIFCLDNANGLRIYSAFDGTLVSRLAEQPFSPHHCVWSPDGTRVAFHANSDATWIWDWQSNQVTVRIRDPQKRPRIANPAPAWSPDSALIYLYSEVYDTATGKEVVALPDECTYASPVQWMPGSNALMLKQNQYTLRIWSIQSAEELVKSALERLGERKLTMEERERFFLSEN